MFDFPALPIAVALSLWDALPLYLSIGVALSVLARAALTGQWFHRTWHMRDTIGVEGMIYAVIFVPVLLPVFVVASIAASLSRLMLAPQDTSAPATPGQAIRKRAEELFVLVLIASAIAAIVKVGTQSLPDNTMAQVMVAAIGGLIAGNRSGVAAIPAVAIAVHLGGILPAAVCILAAVIRTSLLPVLRQRAAAAENR